MAAGLDFTTDALNNYANPYSIASLLGSFENLHASPWMECFLCLGVLDCNANKLASFSRTEAWLDLECLMFEQNALRVHYATSFAEIFTRSLSDLMKTRNDKSNMSKSALKTALCCLENYCDEDHLKCLQKLTRSNLEKMSEADIQTVVACHLFSPLVGEGRVCVDQECYTVGAAKCYFCKAKLSAGITNFGCRDLWHGRADIVIMNKTVKMMVQVCKSLQEESFSDEDGDTSPVKKPKLEASRQESLKIWKSCIEVQKSTNKHEILNQNQDATTITSMKKTLVAQNKAFIKAICQTIINAFLVSKENKSLENNFIPSFIVTGEHIYINLYNVVQDVLLAQCKPFQLLNERNEVSPHTVFALWLALNFEKCPGDCSSIIETYYKKSGFKTFLENSGVLEKYKTEVEFGFFSAAEPESVELIQPNTWNFPQRVCTILNTLQNK